MDRLEYVKKMHADQVHANGVPVLHHLQRVSERLDYFLDIYKEGSEKERISIIEAALGHDVLEDTAATKGQLLEVFGERQYELIYGMTNEWGDEDVTPYVAKVTSSEEAVRLIKLSDLLDNITAVTYNITVLTPEWVDSYFLPVVTSMKESVTKTNFTIYPKTSGQLITIVNSAFVMLQNERARFALI